MTRSPVVAVQGGAGRRPGRIGDSPVVGAGTSADNATCAVSATGNGEALLRAAFAHEVHARIRHGHEDLSVACDKALEEVARLGGAGGCIAVSPAGALAMPFSTPGMFRGWWRPGDGTQVGVAPGECEVPQ